MILSVHFHDRFQLKSLIIVDCHDVFYLNKKGG